MTSELRHHGDRDLAPGLVDLAVNVRLPRPPEWLRRHLAEHLDELAGYPDATAARAAVAARHHRRVSEVLATAGAAEAFTLLARALRPGIDVRHAVVVHPQFTEPEVALATAGHRVHRVLLRADEGFRFAASTVPEEADLVVIGNPTNPTSVLHPASELRELVRPGRILLVDEAFLDAVPGEPESLAGADLPGLVVVRSLTKTWGLAGLRAGYLVGDESLVARIAEQQPPWSVSSLALTAITACLTPAALGQASELAVRAEHDRGVLVAGLRELGLSVVEPARGPFVLVDTGLDGDRLRRDLRRAGYAVRRGDTFPGLGPRWIRLAVREPEVTAGFLAALRAVLTGSVPPAGGTDLRTVPAGSAGSAGVAPDQAQPGPAGAGGDSVAGGGGSVTLVGAGPGDEGLITVRGRDRLAAADVVVTDRLVPPGLLAELAPRVRIIDVSKVPRGPATSQDRINELLVEHASAGLRVVRLKGGDPYVFGRGMEEAIACAAAGVPVEVVPGVSSAVAVPALAGIPVTHRSRSQGFAVVSAHLPPGDPGSTVDWAALARSGMTIVLLMAVRTLPEVAGALLAAGMDPDTPAASVEHGGTPRQRVLTGPLARIAEVAAEGGLRAPAVTVIGPVAAFAGQRAGQPYSVKSAS
ncbi:Rv2231c family pyridoxal phosphate-dependent protein CobC [Solwaraspora sp. WMMD1047]|uniref:Rv2231c family pyridoxal phosphate-dependent protein CobC n=1 Tax=Solwaraspora sp. WMMD1047 TaxID=3016102 RepID=UPI002417533B|nr:Rv2231c family pyridoxal phosphate-dependent protein CobC [Solwaraspora sp. WMMD1047]MDG4832845.1 Rv2231c family pyridoxal phosphate-dependent protein CobC [Solwaraspora sp. WMMD1047]